MDELDDAQKAVLTLTQQFVERQKLVLQIVTELHPELLVIDTPQLPVQKLLELAVSRASKSQIGVWGEQKEWDYFFHGGGCRLVHKVTQERIEWDAPILERFDQYWLCNWVHWLIEKQDGAANLIAHLLPDRNVESLRVFLFDALAQLEAAEAIVRDDPYPVRYVLK